jgi:hypothetical protein
MSNFNFGDILINSDFNNSRNAYGTVLVISPVMYASYDLWINYRVEVLADNEMVEVELGCLDDTWVKIGEI